MDLANASHHTRLVHSRRAGRQHVVRNFHGRLGCADGRDVEGDVRLSGSVWIIRRAKRSPRSLLTLPLPDVAVGKRRPRSLHDAVHRRRISKLDTRARLPVRADPIGRRFPNRRRLFCRQCAISNQCSYRST